MLVYTVYTQLYHLTGVLDFVFVLWCFESVSCLGYHITQ